MYIYKADADSLEKTVDALREGDVAIIPTDTIYGFSGIVPETEQKIRTLKGRSEQKPFIQLLAKPDDIFLYTDAPIPSALFALWPGALTIIVPTAQGTRAEPETVAFRCPGDDWLRRVIALVGKPLYSTSVNAAGCPALTSADEIIKKYTASVPLIVLSDDCVNGKPSTIVDITGGSCKVLREGSVKVV
jgi:L-threonylcarbamoyladenylate synthase